MPDCMMLWNTVICDAQSGNVFEKTSLVLCYPDLLAREMPNYSTSFLIGAARNKLYIDVPV